MRTTHQVALVVSVIALLAGERTGHAYRMTPISRVFAPAGSNATQTFELDNNETDRIALTVSVQTLARDELYNETNQDADDEFLIYPPQIILSPGKRQTVRVTWLGDPKLAREQTYRLVVKQVPIEVLEAKSGATAPVDGRVRVLLSYRGTLFIRPPKAAPQISLAAVTTYSHDSGTTLALTLINDGTAVGLVKHCELTLVSARGPLIMVPAASLAVLQNNRVLAGGRRRYSVALPAGLPPGPMKARSQCTVTP